MSNFDRATFRCEADKVLADFSDEQLGELRAAIDTATFVRNKNRDAWRILEEFFAAESVPAKPKLVCIAGGKR